jgi:hypothetical protein
VAEQLQQNIPEGPTTGTSTSEGSRFLFSINEVPNLTLELLVDPLLHPDKVSHMLEFGHHFVEYTKVCSRTSCSV